MACAIIMFVVRGLSPTVAWAVNTFVGMMGAFLGIAGSIGMCRLASLYPDYLH